MLYAASTEPANLAMRGALLALDGLPGFDALKAQCQGESFVPYEYDGATYGVPFTQQFPMLFYRTDILQELGLSVPQVTQIFLKLRQMGLDIPADVYTIPYAVKTIQKALAAKQGGGANA